MPGLYLNIKSISIVCLDKLYKNLSQDLKNVSPLPHLMIQV